MRIHLIRRTILDVHTSCENREHVITSPNLSKETVLDVLEVMYVVVLCFVPVRTSTFLRWLSFWCPLLRLDSLASRASFRCSIRLNSLFMEENATSHRTAAVKELLERYDIHHKEWPEKSPELNHLVRMWDLLGEDWHHVIRPLQWLHSKLSLRNEMGLDAQQF